MKYRVIRAFQDKNTLIIYKLNAEYTTSDKKRAEELIKGGYIKEIKNTKKSDSA